jgi:hypothetical protein
LRITAPLLIGVLCLTVAALTAGMAAPSKRLVATIVVALPFAAGALVAFRRHQEYLQLLRLQATARSREQPLSAAIPDPLRFIAAAPVLAAEFRAWAATCGRAPLSTATDLENFAVRHGDAIPPDSNLFLQWVAAYGEAIRSATDGRWAIGRVVACGEPVVVSGRFPFLRHRVLLAATQVLDDAADLQLQ